MKWFFVGDDDNDTEYWKRGEEVREVSRRDAELPPLYTYPAAEIEKAPLAGPPKDK